VGADQHGAVDDERGTDTGAHRDVQHRLVADRHAVSRLAEGVRVHVVDG
jgi:hypothetical protein